MSEWAQVPRMYPMSAGDYPSAEQPPAAMQQSGFKPTFMDPDGKLSPGEPVEYKHLNFIFRDLYAKAADMEKRLNTLEGN